MAGDEEPKNSDLRAPKDSAPEGKATKSDAPLPAFIYGRDRGADHAAQGRSGSGDQQSFTTWMADMDRKTLLGLITGAGMLGLVLFFAGMLVGAGLFMDSDDPVVTDVPGNNQIEMLASEPDEPTVDGAREPDMSVTQEASEPSVSPQSDDPVGDLIAERSAAMEEESTGSAGTEPSAAPDAPEAPAENQTASETATESLAAPDIRDLDQAEESDAADQNSQGGSASNTAPAAPDVPATSDSSNGDDAVNAPAAEPATNANSSQSAASDNGATAGERPFSVQVGAFKVHENANQRADELRELGLEVAVFVRGQESDGAWYYVRVGRFATLAEAREHATAIKTDHSLDGFPVRAEPNDREVD
ncbi:SPOR domain-containing protein [Thalassospira sp. MA62]|nr:SPOR domain-containing protein [Thalassospira sp. MA62]